MKKLFRLAALSGAALVACVATGQAQNNPRYVAFQPSATKGALYTPDSGPKSHLSLIHI